MPLQLQLPDYYEGLPSIQMFLSYVNSKANIERQVPIIFDGEAEYEVEKIIRLGENSRHVANTQSDS